MLSNLYKQTLVKNSIKTNIYIIKCKNILSTITLNLIKSTKKILKETLKDPFLNISISISRDIKLIFKKIDG